MLRVISGGDAMKLQIPVMVASSLLAATAVARASVEISSAPTANMTCSGGVCSPTSKDAVLNAGDLAGMLATSDVRVVTGSGAVTITVLAPFSWTSTHGLTLDAHLNVGFRAPVEVTGQGAVTIVTNDGGTGGDLIFFSGGKLDIWDTASTLTVNGTQYTLAADIATLASAVKANPSGAFALTKDYDARPDGTYSLAPVETPVAGTVEGLGHFVSNLTINVTLPKKKEVGLFAEIAGGNLRDLILTNANVTGTGDYKVVGTLAGYSTGTVIGCSADGTVASIGFTTETGGLVGMSGTIARSRANVSVQNGGDSGGLVGYINGVGNITDSYATGSVIGSAAGGLIGQVNNSGIIARSYATGQVTGQDYSAGGLIADNAGGQIMQSYASGNVTGGERVGGLIGAAEGSVVDSYALGQITLTRQGSAGGLMGETYGARVTTSYAIGSAVAQQPKSRKGGFIGDIVNTVLKADFWDISTSGLKHGWSKCEHENRSCEKIIGLTNHELKTSLPDGFDPKIWAQDPNVNNGYPYLIANAPQK
jgi:hypothetical protein